MRIKEIDAQNFGMFRDWKSPYIGGNLMVFFGPNESGKSTLFNLITTLLYGWSPSSKEKNPYVPWDGTNACCSGLIEDDGGDEFSVVRKLGSRPEGIATMSGKAYPIGNSSVDALGGLSREIYTEVFALTLDELRRPDGDVWFRLEDQMLGGEFISFLYPVHEVQEGIEREESSLWRPDRKGNAKDKVLKKELSDLKARLKGASENERGLYELQKKLGELSSELRRKLDKKTQLTEYINRYQRLSPVRKKLLQIDKLNGEAGDISQFDFLPDDAALTLKNIKQDREELSRRIRQLQQQYRQLRGTVDLYSSYDREVEQSSDRIEQASALAGMLRIDLENLRNLDAEIASLNRQLRDKADDVLQGSWSDDCLDLIKKVDISGLRSSLSSYVRSRSMYNETSAKAEGLKSRIPTHKTPAYIAVLSVALVVAGIVGLMFGGGSVVGPILLTSGVTGIAFILLRSIFGDDSEVSYELDATEKCFRRIEREKSDAMEAIIRSIGALPVSKVLLDEPDADLIIDIVHLKDIVSSIEAQRTKKRDIETGLNEKTAAIEKLMHQLNIRSGDVFGGIGGLRDALSIAQEHCRGARDAAERIKECGVSISELQNDIDALVSQEKGILEGMQGIDGSDADERMDNLSRRRNLKKTADAMRDSLAAEYPDIDNIIDEIRESENKNEAWVFDDGSVAKCSTELEQTETEINAINAETGSSREKLEQMMQNDRPDDIEGQIISIEEEIRENRMKRDRLELMKNIIGKSDRDFREEHQPDVLKRASEYIDIITAHRYDSIFIEEGDRRTMRVRDGSSGEIIETDKLSRGTKEQIYLSFRLALMDHIGGGGEKIPAFLDEALVNWDSSRRGNLDEILKRISSKRQIFIFTCDATVAERLSRLPSSQIIEL